MKICDYIVKLWLLILQIQHALQFCSTHILEININDSNNCSQPVRQFENNIAKLASQEAHVSVSPHLRFPSDVNTSPGILIPATCHLALRHWGPWVGD